ncbi:hypothetical protein ABZV64_25085 [Streptomyces sp. NPDC004959]|uniref:hypothetical protein n=1 Tax=unclassified Streptomyces TaxID=2593676 RepID=UPI000691E9B5|nr:hypothetical protein [Streptomyces sp. NRRL F-5630]
MTLAVAAVLTLASFALAPAFTPAHEQRLATVATAAERVPVAGHGQPRAHDPAEVLRTRDRHRAAARGAPSPGPVPLPAEQRHPGYAPLLPDTEVRARPCRSVPDLTPAALQVFLC